MKSSHILCKVNDLAQAVDDYEKLGFTVQWGNPPEKAVNALIWFEQGPFIELLLARKVGFPASITWVLNRLVPNGIFKRLKNWNDRPEGWCDIVLETHDTDVKPEVESLRQQGMKIAGPITGKRNPPDVTTTIRTQTAIPHNPKLPLLMGVYRPNPRPARITHANGATSVHTITVGVEERYRADWAKVLDQDDPWMKLVDDNIGVQSVSLNGLKDNLPPELTHGAVILPATD
jgi:hypothetical protein